MAGTLRGRVKFGGAKNGQFKPTVLAYVGYAPGVFQAYFRGLGHTIILP